MEKTKSYILLIEDDPDDIELTLLAFKKNSIVNDIKVVEDGQEAVDFLFDEHPEGVSQNGFPILILLDLKLPKLNGHEVLKRVKSHKIMKRIPVVILTSSQQEEDILRGYELGANSYIRKPVDYQEFMEVVKNLGVYWLAVNKNPF